jgi:Trypsin-like peptidase domain
VARIFISHSARTTSAPLSFATGSLLMAGPIATLLLPETLPEEIPGLGFGRTLPPLLEEDTKCGYVIGHPGGRGLAYSIQENQLVDYENPGANAAQPRRVHYSSPTEGGSSGSPAFDPDWNVIALHHAGGEYMSRLNGKSGTYPANEGIWIESICAATQASATDGEIWRGS